MRYGFGTQVMFHLNGKEYPAVILTQRSEGGYDIAFEPEHGKVEFTFCHENRLRRITTTMLQLLEKERTRAMKIAHASMEAHSQKQEAQKQAGNRLAFIEGELADECRILGNMISGGDALSHTLGETMIDRLEKEYFATTNT